LPNVTYMAKVRNSEEEAHHEEGKKETAEKAHS